MRRSAWSGLSFGFFFVLLGGCLLVGCQDATTAPEDESPDAALRTEALGGCDAETFEDHDYLFCEDERSWSSARADCIAAGMDLAVIDTAGENSFVRSHAPYGDNLWLGGSDSGAEGNWKWMQSGTQFWSGGHNGFAVGGAYTNWGTIQPDDYYGEDCLLLSQNDGDWLDYDCGFHKGYVCESLDEPEPPPPSSGTDTACWNAPGLAAGAVYPMRGLCPLRRSGARFIGSHVNTVNWVYQTGDDIRTAVAIGKDGAVYFGSNDEYLYCLNPNGTLRWRYKTNGDVLSSPLLHQDGSVVFGSLDDKVYSLDAQTGAVRWSTNLTLDVMSSPAVGEDGVIYIGGDTNRLYALDPGNGSILWSYLTGNDIHSSPAVLPDGNLVFGSDDDFVYVIKPDLGLSDAQRLVWKKNLGSDINSIPAIGPAPDHFIYVRTHGGKVYKLDPADGDTLASYQGPIDLDSDSSPAIDLEGNVYVGLENKLYAFDSDLTVKWSYNTGDEIRTSPVVGADGHIYVGSDNERIYALRPGDGSVLWSLEASGILSSFRGTAAIAKNGAILVGNDDGKMYSIGSFACSPGTPCGNGMGPCTEDSGCVAGTICGHGVAESFGLPADFGVCWDPGDCAKLVRSECGSFRALCGDCCVTSCGAAGTDNGCGGLCGTCVAGADSDRDTVLDCDEQNDADPWTNPIVFNGVAAQQGDACHAQPTCAAIDTRAEVNACFTSAQEQMLASGWDFTTTDRDVCDPGFGFEPEWTDCREDFAVRYEASVRLADTGRHCFQVTGSVADQCGVLFVAGTAITTGAPVCLDLVEGVFGIEWFYETTSGGTNELHVKHCFGDDEDCAPVDPIDTRDLLPPGAVPSCAPDCEPDTCGNGIVDVDEACDTALTAYCTEDCSSESEVSACGSDSDCPQGQFCGIGNGAQFGKDPQLSFCLPRVPCEEEPLLSCGFSGAACGFCPFAPDCGDKECGDDPSDGHGGFCRAFCDEREDGCRLDSDCPADHFCGVGVGPRFGYGPGVNVCIPRECDDPIVPRLDCGTVNDPCGVCPANPNPPLPDTCNPACGSDQYCSSAGSCLTKTATVLPDDIANNAPDIPTAEVGALPGAFQVSAQGTAQYTVPIEVPPGRAGMQPTLALQYDSAAGDGFIGKGWSLTGLPAITRCAKTFATDGEATGVLGTEEDAFCLGSERLIAVTTASGDHIAEYRTELDSFTRVRAYGPTVNPDSSYAGPRKFEARTKEGRILTFGESPGSRRISDGVTVAWYVDAIADHRGNRMSVRYSAWTQERLHASDEPRLDIEQNEPEAIYYTESDGQPGSRKVLFVYNFLDHHKSTPRRFIAGAAMKTSYPLVRIETYVEDQLVRTYKLSQRSAGASWLLDAVQACAPSSAGERCLPPTTFHYDETGAELAEAVGVERVGYLSGDEPPGLGSGAAWHPEPSPASASDPTRILGGRYLVLDANGDGADDLLEQIPTGVSSPKHRWVLRLSRGLVQPAGSFFEPPFEPEIYGADAGHWKDLLHCHGFQVLDFNEDGRDDFFADCSRDVSSQNHNLKGPRYIFVSNGADGFERTEVDDPQYFDNHPPQKTLMTDLDGDGRLDYVLLYGEGKCRTRRPSGQPPFLDCREPPSYEDYPPYQIVWRRNTGGALASPQTIFTTPSFGILDYDGNGTQDILVRTADGQSAILRPAADGLLRLRFGPRQALAEAAMQEASYARSAAIGIDANGDGIGDYVSWPLQTCDWSGGVVPPPGPQLTLQLSTASSVRESTIDLFDGAFYSSGAWLTGNEPGTPACIGFIAPPAFVMDRDNDRRQELYLAPAALQPVACQTDPNCDRWWHEYQPISDVGTGWKPTPVPPISAIRWQKRGPEPGLVQDENGNLVFDEIRWVATWQNWQRPVVMDINGDGVKDLVSRIGNEQDPAWEVRLAQSYARHRLTSVVQGSVAGGAEFGTVTSVAYSPDAYTAGTDCEWPQRCLRKAPHALVSTYLVSGWGGQYEDPLAPARSDHFRRYEHSYTDARADLRGRGFLGFAKHEVTESIANPDGSPGFLPQSTTTTTFNLTTDDAVLKMYWKAGRPETITRRWTVEGNELTGGDTERRMRTTNLWNFESSSAGRPFIFLEVTEQIVEERRLSSEDDFAELSHRTEALIDRDGYGNPIQSALSWGDGRSIGTLIAYDDRPAFIDDWKIALPTLVTILGAPTEAASQSGTKRIQVQTDYDDDGLPEVVTRRSAVGLGALADELVTVMDFDDFGNLVTLEQSSVTVDEGTPPPSRFTKITYDAQHYFPAKLENGLHIGLGFPHTLMYHDPRTGKVAYQKDPSGDWQASRYDGVGRLQWHRDVTGVATLVEYSGGEAGPLRVRVHAPGQPEQVTDYSAFGQPVLQRITRLTQLETQQEFAYDQLGRLTVRGVPHFVSLPSPGATRYAYDALGRVVQEQHPWQHADDTPATATILHMYAGHAHVGVDPQEDYVAAWLGLQLPDQQATEVHLVRDAALHESVQTMDMRGDVVSSFDANEAFVLFAYGAFDHLQLTSFLGVTTSTESDAHGQVTRYTDLDRGVFDYDYNGFGDVAVMKRGTGLSSEQVTSYVYDALGRVTSSETPDGEYTFEWDGDGTDLSLIGRLVSESLSSASIGDSRSEYAYGGPGGLLSEVRKQVRGQWYESAISYNALALPEVVTYPTPSGAPFAVRYDYDGGGYGQVAQVSDADDDTHFWTLGDIDAFGGIASASTSNSVTSQYAREARTGRLRSVRANNGPLVLSHERFFYDERGLLRVRETDVSDTTVVQQYDYDALARLRFHTVASQPAEEYDYDLRGNMTLNPQVGSLYYGAQGKPHAVGSTDDGRSFEYDDFGNQVERDGPDGRQGIQYTAFDLPRELCEGPDGACTRTTSYEYDASGMRIVRDASDGEVTTYVDGLYRQEEHGVTSTMDRIAMVPLPDGRVLHVNLDESTPEDRFQYEQHDHQGSVIALIDGDGALVGNRREYLPFGKPTATHTGVVRSGYTGHEHDREQGLINMRGRMYDPMIGRFLTPDPVLPGIGGTQGINPYSYVLNSPLNLVDPSGFEDEEIFIYGRREDSSSFGLESLYGLTQLMMVTEQIYSNVVDYLQGGAMEPPPVAGGGGSSVLVELARGVVRGVTATTAAIAVEAAVQVMSAGVGRLAVAGIGAVVPKIAAMVPKGVSAAIGKIGAGAKAGTEAAAGGGGRSASGAASAGEKAGAEVASGAGAKAAEVAGGAARGGAGVVRVGQAGEAAVRSVADIGPKAAIDVAGRTRIPDGLTSTVLSEVKNVGSLSYGQQLRDFAAHASANRLRFDLWVRPTTQLSGPLAQAVESGAINLRYIP